MIASEMFLDSAQLKNSMASHAKALNYVPKSNRSSVAAINLNITTSNAYTLTIPKGTTFGGSNLNGNYSYVIDQTLVLKSGNNAFVANNVSIYEGAYNQDSFVVDWSNSTQRFSLINPNIDTDSILVLVSENSGNTVAEFLRADSLYGLTSNSNVYFLETDLDGRYQIVFGDGVLGRTPMDGAVVTVEYRAATGSDSNGVDTFSLDTDLGIINQTLMLTQTITTVSAASGGANTESVESIRYNAPRHFQTQERAVTTNDYEDIIKENFPDIESVKAYGGETLSGLGIAAYGKVFVSCSTYSGNILSDSRKQDVATFLQDRAPLGITPYLIDPDYTYIGLIVSLHVDFSQTSMSSTQLQSLINGVIANYNVNNLQQFGRDFRLSGLMSTINSSDSSILSNEIAVSMYKQIEPSINTSYAINTSFQSAVKPGTVLSTLFLSSGQYYNFADSIIGSVPNGIIYLILNNSSSKIQNYTAVGKIDYSTGAISINGTVFNDVGSGLRIFAAPVKQDIYATKNQILEIDTSTSLTVNVLSN